MYKFKNFMCIAGLAVTLLSESGLWIWRRRVMEKRTVYYPRSGRGKRLFLMLVMVVLPLLSSSAEAAFVLYFESSEQSWVGQGLTVLALPENGYSFSAERNYHNGVSFDIESSSDWWSLELAAPYRATLVPGFYDNAARFPFQDLDQPGLSFIGDGRGDNRNSGHFTVLEAVYGAGGAVESFAVDFTQYDEENPLWWINGKVRYNSDVPFVPEPASAAILGLGSLFFALRRRRR